MSLRTALILAAFASACGGEGSPDQAPCGTARQQPEVPEADVACPADIRLQPNERVSQIRFPGSLSNYFELLIEDTAQIRVSACIRYGEVRPSSETRLLAFLDGEQVLVSPALEIVSGDTFGFSTELRVGGVESVSLLTVLMVRTSPRGILEVSERSVSLLPSRAAEESQVIDQATRLDEVDVEASLTDEGSPFINPSSWGDPIRLRWNAFPNLSDGATCPDERVQMAVAVLNGIEQISLGSESRALRFILRDDPEAILLEVPSSLIDAPVLGVVEFRGIGQFSSVTGPDGVTRSRRFGPGSKSLTFVQRPED